jgi:hypothetical protein
MTLITAICACGVAGILTLMYSLARITTISDERAQTQYERYLEQKDGAKKKGTT